MFVFSTVALDYVNNHQEQFAGSLHKNQQLGNIVLTAAVLSILLTAPLFGALMSWWGLSRLERTEVGVLDVDGTKAGLLDPLDTACGSE